MMRGMAARTTRAIVKICLRCSCTFRNKDMKTRTPFLPQSAPRLLRDQVIFMDVERGGLESTSLNIHKNDLIAQKARSRLWKKGSARFHVFISEGTGAAQADFYNSPGSPGSHSPHHAPAPLPTRPLHPSAHEWRGAGW